MIGLLGLNHKTAPIEIRSKFVFCEDDVRRFIPELKKQGLNGAIVLSTCNRTEIYFDYSGNNIADFCDFMTRSLFRWRKADNKLNKHFYKHYNEDASRHLFKVASGLDSMALGEYQIVGQLKEAYSISDNLDVNTSLLIRLFNKAFEAGKKVRTTTLLSKGAFSISYAAVKFALKKLKNLKSHSALLIGAGQTGELTLQNLIKKGCDNFSITNRTFSKAEALAKQYNGLAQDYSKLNNLLTEQDIVIASTASKKALITKNVMAEIMKKRRNKPIMFIDLSVPRNIAPDVNQLENVSVYDIDDLNKVVNETYSKRKNEIEKAEKIIEEFVDEFSDWQHSRKLTPTFQNISENFQKINATELEGFIKRQINPDSKHATLYAEHITNKFIRLMIRNVRSITDNGRNKEYVALMNDLFKIAP